MGAKIKGKAWKLVPAWIPSCLALAAIWFVNCDAFAAVPSYFYSGFESGDGWVVGPLKSDGSLRLIQGQAGIVEESNDPSEHTLKLEPSALFSAVLLDGNALGKAPVAFCDLLVRPYAVAEQSGEEFMDFGGAIAGFVRVGGYGELRVLFGRTEQESVWIATGIRVALDSEGRAERWLHLTMRLNRQSQRWEIRESGKTVLAGLKTNATIETQLALWLYGASAHAVEYDDLLLTTVEPEQLQKLVEAESQRKRLRVGHPAARQAPPQAVLAPQMVISTQSNRDVRRDHAGSSSEAQQGQRPDLRGWSLTVQTGNSVYPAGDIVPGKTTRLDYKASRGKDGKFLPVTFTFTADAELRPGLDLKQLRWAVTKHIGAKNLFGPVIEKGDFQSGLVQTVTVPGDSVYFGFASLVWATPSIHDEFWDGANWKPGDLKCAARVREQATNADKNGDGIVTREELLADISNDRRKSGQTPAETAAEMMQDLDLNRDNRLTAAEIDFGGRELQRVTWLRLNMRHALEVLEAVGEFKKVNNGHLPQSLQELVRRGIASEASIHCVLADETLGTWDYLPPKGTPANRVIICSPSPVEENGMLVAGLEDGRVMSLKPRGLAPPTDNQ